MFRRLLAATCLFLSLLPTPAIAARRHLPPPTRPLVANPKVAHILGPIGRDTEYSFEMEMLQTGDLPGDRLIVIDSPGGEVGAGNQILDAIEREQVKGTRVTCVVIGNASSMAFNILTHCDVRLATATARMVVHKVAIYGTPDGMRLTSTELRNIADDLDRTDAPFRRDNARAMHLSLADYDLFADKETCWSARTLLEIGYLNGIVAE